MLVVILRVTLAEGVTAIGLDLELDDELEVGMLEEEGAVVNTTLELRKDEICDGALVAELDLVLNEVLLLTLGVATILDLELEDTGVVECSGVRVGVVAVECFSVLEDDVVEFFDILLVLEFFGVRVGTVLVVSFCVLEGVVVFPCFSVLEGVDVVECFGMRVDVVVVECFRVLEEVVAVECFGVLTMIVVLEDTEVLEVMGMLEDAGVLEGVRALE